MSILDHVTLIVSDYARSKAFYEKALAPLGVAPIMEYGKACGFGRGQKPDFWIGQGPTSYQTAEQAKTITPTHLAFAARTRAEVNAFHAAALTAGGKEGKLDVGARALAEATRIAGTWLDGEAESRPTRRGGLDRRAGLLSRSCPSDTTAT